MIVTMTAATDLRRRRVNLVQQVHRSRSASEVFDTASIRLRQLVPFDAAAWLGTDPGTGLPTSPVRIDELDGVSQSMCSAHWQHELLADDVNLFRDLARAEVPAAAFRRAVGDEPEHSRRFRRFLRPLGFHDELRTVLRVGDAPWGSITLWRREGQSPFTDREAAIVAGLSAPIAEALRRHARPTDAEPGTDVDRPGLLLFDNDGEVVSANEDARHWLDELPAEPGVPTDYGVLPVWMLITVFRAAAIRHGAGDGTARTRVRTRRGRWLACHASCLRAADGTAGEVALVVEPAPPAAVAPLVVEAYDLTEREQEIVHLLARGWGTAEIADELFLSRHTVRDHVKAIFAKAGVTSRGELVAKLFAEFYEPLHAYARETEVPSTPMNARRETTGSDW
jgi:DNA-binding CsgD family transcriptional regulator